MNVGQLLEVHLGWASKELGKKIGELVEKSKNLSEVKPFVEKIYSSTGKLAASGSVFSKGEYAYLFAGGVMPRYRKKGLWKCLLAARQAITVGQGVKYWLYTSGNPFIHQKGDVVFKNLTLKKDPE